MALPVAGPAGLPLVAGNRRTAKRAAAAILFFLLLILVVLGLLGAAQNPFGGSSAGIDPRGVPAGARPYLAIYADAARAYGVNQFLLMAVHEDETNFGRSTAPGVRSGVNFAGCCAGPMQFLIAGGADRATGGRGGTWAGYADAYKTAGIERPAGYPGRTATHPNVYDSFDAIYAAAKYFKSLGAGPQLDQRTFQALLRYKGTPPASTPYARADYERALQLQKAAAAYLAAPPQFGSEVVTLEWSKPWLAPVPGFPNARCDRRILPNLVYLIQEYELAVGDCYATKGHARKGEHPLGLGVDLVPAGGNWDLVDQLAAAVEPQQDRPIAPFRWVGYNGDADHGRGDHLHLSWDHSPAGFGEQAQFVRVAR